MATSLRELVVSVSADTSKYQREMDRASRMGGQYFRSIQQGGADATRSWDRQTSAARTHATAIEASSQAVMRYATVAATALGLGQITQLADGWTNLNNRLRLVTDGATEFAAAQANVLRIAQETRQPLDATAELYQRIAQNQDALGLSGQGVADIVQTISQAMVVSGTTSQGAQAALVQLGQAFASGTLRGEELNSVLEQAPALARAVADGLGVPIGRLREMGAAGELTADQVIGALQRQSSDVDDAFSSMDATISQAMTNLRTSFQIFIGQSDDVAGASTAIARGINALSQNMEAIATVGGAAAIGAVAGRMVQLGVATAQAAVSALQSRAAVVAEAVAIRDASAQALAKAQADVRRTQAAMTAARGTAESARQSRAYAAALLTERQAATAAAAAQENYARATNLATAAGRSALAFLGGPAGLALTLGAAAAGWALFRSETTQADTALANWTGTADEAVAKFRELNAEQRAGAILTVSREIEDAERDVNAALDRILTAPRGTIGGDVWATARQGVEQLRAEYAAGAIDADTFSARSAELARQMLESSGSTERLGSQYIGLLESLANAAREADRKRGVLGTLTQAQGDLAQATSNATGVIAQQAGAVDAMASSAEAAGQRIRNAIQSLPGQIARLGRSPTDVAAMDASDWVSGLESQGRPYLEVEAARDAGRHYVELVRQQEAAQQALDAATRSRSQSARAQISEEEREAQRLVDRYEDLIASQQRQIALHGEIGQAAAVAYDTAHGALSGLNDDQRRALNENAAWIDFLDDMSALEGVWADVAADHATYADRTRDTFDRMSVYADQAARNMHTHFADFLFDPFEGGVNGMVSGFSDAIRRMVAEAASSRLFEMVGGAMSGYSGQGTFGNMIRGFGGVLSQGAGRAGGGHVRPNSLHPVAEHGPELLQVGGQTMLMMGAAGGLVSPLMNKAAGGASAGAPMQVVINNHGSGHVNAREDRQQMPDGQTLKLLIIDVVAESLDGGAIGQVGRNRYGWRPAV